MTIILLILSYKFLTLLVQKLQAFKVRPFFQNFKIQNFDPPQNFFGVPLDPQSLIPKMSMVYLFVKKIWGPYLKRCPNGSLSNCTFFRGGGGPLALYRKIPPVFMQYLSNELFKYFQMFRRL